MVDLIGNVFCNSKIDTDVDLFKNILFSINQGQLNTSTYDDKIFKNMYTYLITNNLYNPNWNIGVSSEPLYVLLPNILELFEVNLIVYSNLKIDWQILNNGSDSFMSFIYKYLNSKDTIYKNYYLEIIKIALSSSFDIESTVRYKSEIKNVCYQMDSIRTQLSKINDIRLNEMINNKLKVLKKYKNCQ